MGGVAKAIESPFRTGASQAKRAQRQMEEQARLAQQERQRQENVAKAQASLAEDKMFSGKDDGLDVEGADYSKVDGVRKRRRVQNVSTGLGIGGG